MKCIKSCCINRVYGMIMSHKRESLFSDDSSEEYDSGTHKNQCWLIQKSVVLSREIEEYFQSKEWKKVVYWDEVLHQAANIALDMTIEKIGRKEFDRNLRIFRQAQQELVKACSAKVVVPCNSPGAPVPPDKTDCIIRDSGCGFSCMDEFFRQW